MTYAEFERQKKAEEDAYRKDQQRRADIAYNKGVWDSVKYNPFAWWLLPAVMRKIDD